MVHFDQVGEFVLHYVVLQMLRHQHEIERQVNAAAAAARAPARLAFVYVQFGWMQVTCSGHLPDSRQQQDLGMPAQALLNLLVQPFLYGWTCEVHILRIVCYELSPFLSDSQCRDIRFLQMEMKAFGIYAEVSAYYHAQGGVSLSGILLVSCSGLEFVSCATLQWYGSLSTRHES